MEGPSLIALTEDVETGTMHDTLMVVPMKRFQMLFSRFFHVFQDVHLHVLRPMTMTCVDPMETLTHPFAISTDKRV